MLMNTTEPYLNLEIDSVTTDLHNIKYTCRAISLFGIQSKSLTIHVSQQLPNNSVAGLAGGVVAVLVITLVGLVLISFIVIR